MTWTIPYAEKTLGFGVLDVRTQLGITQAPQAQHGPPIGELVLVKSQASISRRPEWAPRLHCDFTALLQWWRCFSIRNIKDVPQNRFLPRVSLERG